MSSGPKTPPSERSSHGLESATMLAPPLARPGDERFLSHLATAGELVSASRYRDAEVEVLRALSGMPADLRALNLLALVRFKLGRLEDARATYREIATATPNDAATRRHLGLLALKLERVDEAIAELEMAARLAPGDEQAWSYLGYAYTKKGEPVPAAAAFRRARQDALAAELEHAAKTRRPATGPEVAELREGAARTPPPRDRTPARDGTPSRGAAVIQPPSQPASSVSPAGVGSPTPKAGATPVLAPPSTAPRAPISELRPAAVLASPTGSSELVVAPPPVVEETGPGELVPVPLLGFVLARLGLASAPATPRGEALRLAISDEAYVRADAVLAAVGVRTEPAYKRVQGRRSSVPLGARDGSFFRLVGPGEVWVAGAPGRWQALWLEDDILYVREDRVLAFDGGVSWEAGSIPGDGMSMLQFRGRGCVVLHLDAPPAAVKVTEDGPAVVARARLLGWVGRVVTHKQRADGPSPFDLTCQGEGVVLFDLDGNPDRVPKPSGARFDGRSPSALGKTGGGGGEGVMGAGGPHG